MSVTHNNDKNNNKSLVALMMNHTYTHILSHHTVYKNKIDTFTVIHFLIDVTVKMVKICVHLRKLSQN